MLELREVRLAAGAEFVVMVCGEAMRLSGLPRLPAGAHIDDAGRVVGLS